MNTAHCNASLNSILSKALTHALCNLAAYPRYVAEMRAEVEAAVQTEDGWSKKALDRMVKLDSFLKEGLRTGSVVDREHALSMTLLPCH